jgi:hypothetical protein
MLTSGKRKRDVRMIRKVAGGSNSNTTIIAI